MIAYSWKPISNLIINYKNLFKLWDLVILEISTRKEVIEYAAIQFPLNSKPFRWFQTCDQSEVWNHLNFRVSKISWHSQIAPNFPQAMAIFHRALTFRKLTSLHSLCECLPYGGHIEGWIESVGGKDMGL